MVSAAMTLATAVGGMEAAAQASDGGPLPTIELPSELDRVLRDYERGWQARDAEALTALFTEDGFVLRPGRPPARGRDAILAAYTNSGGPLALTAYEYATEGEVGYIIGGFAIGAGQPPVGKFVLVLRRDETGRWLIVGDIDNGN